MIFSSQLGKLDGRSNEQSIQSIANHLRKMQEELEYRLSVLDSSNINEINADQTKFLVKGKEINNIISDQEGRMSQFQQTVEGFNTAVSEYGKSVTEYQQTVDGFKTSVDNYAGKYSEWTQTVNGFKTQVADYEKGYSEWTQTVDSFTQQVKDYTTGYSAWEQTVAGFNQTVSNYTGQYSSWQQTVSGFQQTVSNVQAGLSTTLKMDTNGIYIIDQNGKMVTISGSQIDASTIRVQNLYGDYIYLRFLDYYDYEGTPVYSIAGTIHVTGSSSSMGGTAVELTSGALRFEAQDGDVFIDAAGYVTLSGSSGNTSQGNFTPTSSDSYTLGAAYYKWQDVYSVNSEINTSDRTKKNSIDYDMAAYERLFDLLKPCSYKFNDGTSDRKHVGMIAQDVEDALAAAGLTTKDFAGFIKSPKTDEDGNIIEYEYGLRIGEFMGMCIAEIQKLKSKVTELERKGTDNGQAG